MKQSSESANFVLQPQVINLLPNTPIEIIFNNIDMTTVLGDMYYKYKYFKIVLNSYCGWASTSVTYSPTNVVYLGMTGLDFVAATFNGEQTNMARFPNVFIMPSNGANTIDYANDHSGIVFRKPNSSNVKLQLYFLNPRTTTDIIVSTNNTFTASFNFNFTIHGLYEDE
jgi:hypothetical protein